MEVVEGIPPIKGLHDTETCPLPALAGDAAGVERREDVGGPRGRGEGRGGARDTKETAPVKAASLHPGLFGEITSEHRRLWALVSRKMELGLRKRDPKNCLEHLKAVKLAGDILSVVVRGQRQAWGLDVLEGSLTPDDTEEIIEEMESLTSSRGADEALERG